MGRASNPSARSIGIPYVHVLVDGRDLPIGGGEERRLVGSPSSPGWSPRQARKIPRRGLHRIRGLAWQGLILLAPSQYETRRAWPYRRYLYDWLAVTGEVRRAPPPRPGWTFSRPPMCLVCLSSPSRVLVVVVPGSWPVGPLWLYWRVVVEVLVLAPTARVGSLRPVRSRPATPPLP